MTNGFFGDQFAYSRQCHGVPLFVLFFPIKRGVPAPFLHSVPPQRKPKLGAPVPSILHKRQILSIRYEPRGQFKRLNKNTMTKPFIVITEPLALMSHPV